MSSAVVLLSGGLDSTVTAAQALDDGFDVHALTIQYGQRHERELRAAREVPGRSTRASTRCSTSTCRRSAARR
jgi:7-cyano-7-deazaguanine synthase